MPWTRLRDTFGSKDHDVPGDWSAASGRPSPRVVDAGEVELGAPWAPPTPDVREIRHVTARPSTGNSPEDPGMLSGALLVLVALVLAAAMTGAGYVVYGHQTRFALEHSDHNPLSARIVGGLPEVGWICMAALAVVAALRARSSLRARTGVVMFFSISIGAQLLYAPRNAAGWLVAVIAPVTLAWCLETYLVELRQWVLRRRIAAAETSGRHEAAARYRQAAEEIPILSSVGRLAWRVASAPVRLLVGVVLWLIRLGVDFGGTKAGVKEWVLEVAPTAPGRTGASMRAAAAEQQAAELGERHDQELAALREQYAEQVRRLAAEGEELRAAATKLTTKFELLAGRSTSRARLATEYEWLRESGDPRYGDRAAVAEVARELYAAAGLTSEGTARAYLAEHISEIDDTKSTVRSSGLSGADAMIGAYGVNGS